MRRNYSAEVTALNVEPFAGLGVRHVPKRPGVGSAGAPRDAHRFCGARPAISPAQRQSELSALLGREWAGCLTAIEAQRQASPISVGSAQALQFTKKH